jgi:hypothetical protein
MGGGGSREGGIRDERMEAEMKEAFFGVDVSAARTQAVSARVRVMPQDEEIKKILEQESLRLNDRYLMKVIEGHGFCPYAKQARQTERMRRYVVLESPWPAAGVLGLMEEVARDQSQEVVQVIFPLLEIGAGDWRAYVKALDGELEQRGRGGVLASAAFHPQASYMAETAGALVPLFRRSPDPTIQWTRLDVLRGVSGGGQSTHFMDVRNLSADEILARLSKLKQPLSERIAAANWEAARALGVARVEAMLAEIAEDRRQTYDRLLGAAAPRPLDT